MRVKIEIIVYICMFAVIYHNWTDFPRQQQIVRGSLEKIGIENENMDHK
jgi:hypothetical protein